MHASLADDPIAVYNNCGPLQQCLDAQNLNNGFSSFDNMPSALLTLFQALSTDGQYQIMWACLQSEPDLSWPIIVYFMAVGIIVGQVLINVFVAVLANVLGHYRALFNLAIEQHFAEQEESQQGNSPGNKHALSALGSSMQSLESVDGRLPRQSGDVNEMENEGSEKGGDLGMGTEEGKSGMGKQGTERNENILSDETKRMTTVATMVFRSDLYNAFVMLAIFGNCMSLALIGSLGSVCACKPMHKKAPILCLVRHTRIHANMWGAGGGRQPARGDQLKLWHFLFGQLCVSSHV